MSYASAIIDKFGGTRKMANTLGLPPSTIQSWKDTGLIPAKHQQTVLEQGRSLENPVVPEDFFEMPAEQSDAA